MIKPISASPFLIAFLVLALASSTYAQLPNRTSTVSEWQRYEVGKGNLSVLFPNEPKETRQATPSSEREIGTDMYLYTSAADGAVYVSQVSFLDKPAASWTEPQIEGFYQGVWKGLKESFDANLKRTNAAAETKLIEQKRVTFAGSRGVEFVFTYGATQGRVLVTLVGSRSFAGMILGTEKVGQEIQEQFFSSFTIRPIKTTKA